MVGCDRGLRISQYGPVTEANTERVPIQILKRQEVHYFREEKEALSVRISLLHALHVG